MLCFEGTIIFCSRLKIHRKISLKKVTLKSGCLNCNVRNTLSSTHTFKVLRANQSIFLLGTKGTLKILSRYVWPPLMNILTSKLGFKILCNFFRANLHCFTSFQRRKTTLMLFNRQFECKRIIKHLFSNKIVKFVQLSWPGKENN